MRFSSFVAVLGVGAILACGAQLPPQTGPGGDDGGGGGGNGDGSMGGPDAGMTPPNPNGPFRPALVFVNGLVKGTATTSLTLSDVRFCIENVTPHPLPDDHPMPLANYPGVGVGQGVDLGPLQGLPTGTVTLDVFNAQDLSSDASWTSTRLDCPAITCDPTSGPPCRAHVSLQVDLAQAVNLVVLTDDSQQQSVKLSTTPLDGTYTGTPSKLRAQVADFAGWHAGDEVTADFGQLPPQSAPTAVLSTSLGTGTPSPTATLDVLNESYEGYGVWVTQVSDGAPGDTFAQSLGSIQWVSDPITAPSTFYDIRENFALLLVGDPNNRLLSTNGRDPAFDGRALHFVAVPFAAGVAL